MVPTGGDFGPSSPSNNTGTDTIPRMTSSGDKVIVVCATCSARLSIPAASTATTFTCPHCKAKTSIDDGIKCALNAASSAARRTSSSSQEGSGISRDAAVAIGVCLLVAIGLVMTFQSVSLMSGSTSVWLGVALVTVGAAGAFVLRGATWVRVVASIVLAIALANAISIEVQMSKKRDELTHIFDHQ